MNYSILMSVYKKEKPEYLIASIESMLAQTVPAEQFVIVKDGPLTAELDSVIQSYVEKDPELFTIVSLAENVGLGRALDCGMTECRNELIARMDSDDISLPERCEKQLKRFCNNSHLDIVSAYISEFEEEPSCIRTIREVPESYENILVFSRRRQPFNHPVVMYKKSAVLRCGGYGQAKRKEDLYLFLSMLNSGCFAENIPESLLCYRANVNNLKRRKSWINCKESIQAYYWNYCQGYSGLMDLLVVIMAQMMFFLLPDGIAQFFSDTFLRKNSES